MPKPGSNIDVTRMSGGPAWRFCFEAVCAVYLVLLLQPLYFRMPASDLDSSAQLAVAYAFVSGWQWGRDIVFAYAPLGFIYPRPFVEGTLLITALFWTSVGVGLAVTLLTFLRAVPVLCAGALFAAFAIPMAYSPDMVFFSVPILAALAHLRNPERARTGIIVFLAVVAGVAALIKLTFGVLSIVVFLALDFDQIRRKRLPLLSPVFLLTFILGYLLSGQDPEYFVPFIRQSLEHVSGYSEAMQLWGSVLELFLFLAASAAVALLIFGSEWIRVGVARPILPKFLFCVICGLVWLMVFKAGFVRQDLHTLTSWAGLSVCLSAYAAAMWRRLKTSMAVLFVALTVVFAAFPAVRMKIETGKAILISSALVTPWQQFASVRSLVWNPAAWLARERQNANAHLALVRREIPLSPLDGSVDLIQPAQAAVIAHGLDYRPRPNLQDYIAYTPVLVDVNLEFIRSARAPKYILHGAGTVDSRYPSLADGPMWPEFLRLYEPIRFEGRYLLLRRRSTPVDSVMSEAVSKTVRLGEVLEIPTDGPKFVAIQIHRTLIGQLALLLFKPGILSLTVKLVDGSERTFRIVPGIVSKGFVLSPLIDNNVALAGLSVGQPEHFKRHDVVSMRVDIDAFSAYMFKPAVEVRIRTLQPEKWRTASVDPEIASAMSSYRYLTAAASSASMPGVALDAGQLFAHAPAMLSIPTPGIGKLTIGFGMRDGAWQGEGKTEGACFRILAGADVSSAVALWNRCLRPMTEVGDRGPQTASLDIGPQHQGRLFLETDCAGTCSWDWTYWDRIDLATR